MALASWTGLYTPVVQAFMRAKQIKELMLLQAIAQHADPFGFAFPGPKALLALMRCSRQTLETLLRVLEEGNYIKIYRTYNPRRGKTDTDFQINPHVLYVREEIQAYCDALWMGAERDFDAEKQYRGNLFSTKESQPESESESESISGFRVTIQSQHQHRAVKPEGARRVTTGQRDSATPQRQQAHDKNNLPQAGGSKPKRDLTPFQKPFPTLDDEQLAQDIKIAVGTQASLARWAMSTYPRSQVLIALELTKQKRSRGELLKPGGYFFAILDNGVIDPEQDGQQAFPPRQSLDLDGMEHWDPTTGRYEAAGD